MSEGGTGGEGVGEGIRGGTVYVDVFVQVVKYITYKTT